MDVVKGWLSELWGALQARSQTVDVWDFVDILIVAYIIYRILTFMRKTSASSVIKGIALLLVLAVFSNIVKMNVITYLLDEMLQIGVLVLVVLFQPEIRKLFEQVGNSRISFFFRKRARIENAQALLGGVIAAAVTMAKSRTGALIVFERKVGLNDYASTGIRVDANVSSELIQNIFYHNSPLHDGAVLIRDWRILAAACMLPMTNNININRDLGMRHKAGIGISERSDALAVIVSEQTGAISVASDGMLKRGLSEETFRQLLENELMQGERKAPLRKLKVKK